MRIRLMLCAAVLPLQTAATPLSGGDCQAWRDRRDRLASEAMRAEIALVQEQRRRLCPVQEALAERAHADAPPNGPPPETTVQGELDYGAYGSCRRQAEARLRRIRTVQYTNAQGFRFYTVSGARLARSADALQQQLAATCQRASGPP
jgi:hypothetical protein